ncbi:hypothetical protein ACO22_07235 [Paracoccidioides brasiliensis]|uniref:Uncharacterized protein n=1 Tax=Paracoccidioides brasiliensis TaxID=121759 RepID=A0A1D2J584_PARBR|nr:hypothetical protein ACO22_07235 [Paracoccidioides brasiliensis]
MSKGCYGPQSLSSKVEPTESQEELQGVNLSLQWKSPNNTIQPQPCSLRGNANLETGAIIAGWGLPLIKSQQHILQYMPEKAERE